MSELLEPKIDLLIDKIDENLSQISYELKTANTLKKIEIAHKMKYNTQNQTDLEIIKAMTLIEKIIAYDNLDCNLRDDLQEYANNYERYVGKRFNE